MLQVFYNVLNLEMSFRLNVLFGNMPNTKEDKTEEIENRAFAAKYWFNRKGRPTFYARTI